MMAKCDDGNYNIGISLLKILMSFEVVFGHFWVRSESLPLYLRPFYILLHQAVPCFMILSFMFTGEKILRGDKMYLKKRLYRLFIPHLFWTLGYWIAYNLINIKNAERCISWKEMIWQLLFGHSIELNPTMWYQVNLIVITVLFYILVTVSKQKLYVLLGMAGGIFTTVFWN